MKNNEGLNGINELNLTKPCVICRLPRPELKAMNERLKNQLLEKFIDVNELQESISELELSLETSIANRDHRSDRNFIGQAKMEYLHLRVQELMKQRDDAYLNLSVESVRVDKLRRDRHALNTRRHELGFHVNIQKDINNHLKKEMSSLSQQLDSSRWSAALDLFVMMKIEVDTAILKDRYSKTSIEALKSKLKKAVMLTGCSTILSLPLTNNGVYDDLPIELVTSALSHVCHLVDSVAAVLNIPLPHPIKPFENFTEACITPHGVFNTSHRSVLYPLRQAHRISDDPIGGFCWDSLASLSKDVKSSQESSSSISSSHDSSKVKQRSSDWSLRSYFTSGLVLLRADVLTLCLRAGIPPEQLFPTEAILLNLYLLHRTCISNTKLGSAHPYVDPSIMLDVTSKECERILTDRYKSKRWSQSDSPLTTNDRSHGLDASSVNIDSLAYDDARIVSTEADWAVVDVDKPTIT